MPRPPHRARTTPRRPGPATAGRRRWRLWLVLAGISIGGKLVVFTLGAAMPRWLINDGIAQLPAPLQGYGREARQTAIALWNGPIERHGLVQSVRVMSVSSMDGASDASDATPLPAAAAIAQVTGGDSALRARPARPGRPGCDGRSAVVRAYTYFAIPYSEVRTVCDRGVVEYRVFRRRRPPTERGPA